MQRSRLIIVRHGNTFLPDELPRRVGGRTDLPLVPSGIAQAKALGVHFRNIGVQPKVIYTGPLKRTRETAALIKAHAPFDAPIEVAEALRELDYGPDENQPEAQVLERLSKAALDNWEAQTIPPDGWRVDVEGLLSTWRGLGQRALADYPGQDVLLVTSNGVARFAATLVGSLRLFGETYGFKLGTGAYGLFEAQSDGAWRVVAWNKRP